MITTELLLDPDQAFAFQGGSIVAVELANQLDAMRQRIAELEGLVARGEATLRDEMERAAERTVLILKANDRLRTDDKPVFDCESKAGHAALPTGWLSVESSAGERRAVFDLVSHVARQMAFSLKTFGPGERTEMVVEHIRKELIEITEAPQDLMEWIDVVLLGLDGAWRTGAGPAQIAAALDGKLAKNERRKWPDWRVADPHAPIEHVRA